MMIQKIPFQIKPQMKAKQIKQMIYILFNKITKLKVYKIKIKLLLLTILNLLERIVLEKNRDKVAQKQIHCNFNH